MSQSECSIPYWSSSLVWVLPRMRRLWALTKEWEWNTYPVRRVALEQSLLQLLFRRKKHILLAQVLLIFVSLLISQVVHRQRLFIIHLSLEGRILEHVKIFEVFLKETLRDNRKLYPLCSSIVQNNLLDACVIASYLPGKKVRILSERISIDKWHRYRSIGKNYWELVL